MAKSSKRVRAAREKVDREKHYAVGDAINLVKELTSVKFDETVDASINLGVNARKSDQNVRGATVLPKGTGKSVRVAVFAEGDDAEAERQQAVAEELRGLWRQFTDLHEQAIAEPGNAELRWRIARIARQLDRDELARTWLRAALAVDPTHGKSIEDLRAMEAGLRGTSAAGTQE